MDTKIVRNIINIAMPIMMITLIAYQLIGKAYHEYAGTALFIIFIIHNILNIKWYSKLFKGNYTPYRILSTIINILLLITMILLMISGIIMSEYTFATVYKGNIIKNLIMDCQSYAKYRPNETTGGIFVSWRRKEELPTGA